MSIKICAIKRLYWPKWRRRSSFGRAPGSNRKIVKPWFDSLCGSASLCPCKGKYCFPPWTQAIYPLWWPSLTKDVQTEQLLCWSGMTDTEHITSGSNEEDRPKSFDQKKVKIWQN